eukprot:gene5492-6177_t
MARETGRYLKKLRTLMKNPTYVKEVICAYIIPSADAHQSEYLAPCHKRREFISGFTGSAGTAIVTDNKALLWTDGRYHEQAAKELDSNYWTLMKDGLPGVPTKEDWLSKELPIGSKIGVDPTLISLDEWRKISKKLANSGRSLIRADRNLVDVVWADYGKPEPPNSNIISLDFAFAGKKWKDKIEEVREKLKEKEVDAVVVVALDEIAWLFNLRGSDIDFNPVFFAYAIVSLDDIRLHIDLSRITNVLKDHLGGNDSTVQLLEYDRIQEGIRNLVDSGKKIWISSRNSAALSSLIPEDKIISDVSPVCLLKAIKNATEIEGMKQAHIRDSVALCEYFYWLEKEIHKGYLNEFNAAEKLEELRKEQENFVSLSFPTISSSGPNGAVIHYRPESSTARMLTSDELYLCDSGAQFFDGTTDVTRTLHFGTPSQYEKECFTLVLKGHIQLASTLFPRETRGHVLDIIARRPLWSNGLNYLHGTGHGIGAFLNVHEGPHGISPRVSEDEPLKSGMFVTDEPGYYEDGNFGIRIENVLLVKDVSLKYNFKKTGFLGFEAVTLVPIQSKMLVPDMLTDEEITWLNNYHSTCKEKALRSAVIFVNFIMVICFVFYLLFILGANVSADISVQDAIELYKESAIANVKVRLHKAAQKHEAIRQRRSTQLSFLNHSSLPEYGLDVDSITPFQSVSTSYAVKIKPFQIGNSHYLAVANYRNRVDGKYRSVSEIYKFVNGKFKLSQQFQTTGCVDFEFAKLLMENYVIFVENVGTNWLGSKSYSQSFKVYKHVKSNSNTNEFEFVSSIGMLGGTCVRSFVHSSKNYFVAANSYSIAGNKNNAKSVLYVKTTFGFLMVQQFETQGAQDVEVFRIDGLVYIAFANHKDNEERVDIYSTVYREKRPLGSNGIISFEHAQRILTHGAMDFEYFHYKNNHYLAVANQRSQLITYNTKSTQKNLTVTDDYEVDSLIYWWSGKFFVEWQKIPTNGALKISSFNVKDTGILLTVANSKSDSVIYTYDAIRGLFKPTKIKGFKQSLFNSVKAPDVRSIELFVMDNETYAAVANYKENFGNNIFRINFAYLPLKDRQLTIPETIAKSLSAIKKQLGHLKDRLSKTKMLLKNVMTVDGNQTVTGFKKFQKANIKRLKVKNLIYSKYAENNPIEKAVHQAMLLKTNLTENEKVISELEERFKDAVRKDSPENITGHKIFTNSITFTNVSVDNMDVGLLNSVNITEFKARALSKSNSQEISGRYEFIENVTLLHNLTVAGLINGIRIPDGVMTTNTAQEVTGTKLFTEDINIHGNIITENFTINGMRIPDDLVLKSAKQRILGSKYFKSRVRFQKSVRLDGIVNGRNLSEFSRKVVRLSRDQVITGRKTFLNGFKANSNLNVERFVDGVNLTDLYFDAVRKNSNETIKGTKRIFGSLSIKGDVDTLSTTNGINLRDDVMTTNTDQVITAKKTFQNIFIKGNIMTNSTVDGIDLSEDAVTTNTDQTISGRKTFQNDVVLLSHLNVTGTIDGVDVKKLNNSAAKVDEFNSITAPKIFTGKVTIKDKLSIGNEINGIRLKDLKKSIVTINSNEEINAPMTFESIELLSDMKLNGRINGFRIPEDLVPLNEDVNLTSYYTFVDNVTLMKDLQFSNHTKLNGRKLSSFAENVVLDGVNQTIYGKKTFQNLVSMKSIMTVDGKINNFSIPDDFVTLNTVQNISGRKQFDNKVIIHGELSTDLINVSTTINGVFISDLLKNVIYRDENRTIEGNITFTGNVTSIGGIKVGGLVDNVDVEELAKDLVYISKPQNITGLKLFTTDVEFIAPLQSPGKINGVNLTELDSNSLKKNRKQLCTGTKVFTGSVVLNGNLESLTVNGFNLPKFVNETAKKNESQTISGSLHFLNNVSIGTMKINGTVVGINFNDLMLTFGNQTIYGYKMFAGSLNIRDGLHVGKYINGLNLTALDKEIMKINENQNVSAHLVFESGFNVNGSIDINGTVNEVDISELNLTSVHINDKAIIGGKKIFKKDVTIRGDVIFQKDVNGINVTNLLSDAMLKSEEQVLCANKIFTSINGTYINSKLTAKNLKSVGLINGVNIRKLNENVVRISTNQVLHGNYSFSNHVSFDGNIISNGLVNNINVTRDIVTKKDDQVIIGYKEFENLNANKSIEVTGTVDGVDLSEFAKSRVTLSTNQNITGIKQFESRVKILGDLNMVNNAKINNIDVSKDLILLNKPSLISGKKTFKSTITVVKDMNITGLINGINLKKLEKEIASLNHDKKVYGGMNTFMKNLKVSGNIQVDGYINNIRIGNMYNNMNQLKKLSMHQLQTLNSSLPTICKKTKILMTAAGAEIYLTSVEKIGSLNKANLGQVHSISIGDYEFVSIARYSGSSCGPAHILKCTTSLSCVIHQVIRTRAINMYFYPVANEVYLFVGHWGQLTDGCSTYPEILRYDKITGRFASYFNVTLSLYSSIQMIKRDQVLTANIMALIPVKLLSSDLFTTPTSSLGSILTQKPAMTRTFVNNGSTFLVTASVLVNIYYIEVFKLNRTTLEATKIQQIPTREVSSIEVGMINDKIMLASAEGRHSTSRDVKIYEFTPAKNIFYFYQRVLLPASSVKFGFIYKRSYLAYASPENGFGLCPWRGITGFEKCLSIPDVGIRYIDTIVTTDGVFAIGATNNQMVIYKAFFKGVVDPFGGHLNC